ncbi:MAG: hypothetical protein AAFQ45_11985 [Pseudomonadota bacterium]
MQDLENRDRAQRASRRMALATRVLMAIVLLAPVVAAVWFAIDRAPFEALARARFGPTTSLSSALQLTLIAAVLLVQAGLLAAALNALASAFQHLAARDPLNASAARAMRASGMLLGLATLAAIALQVPLSYAVTMLNGPGARAISVAISSGHIVGLFAAAALIAIGHVLTLAAEVRADQKQFV